MDRILVPVDGSPTSEHAAERAIEVARKYNSKLTFITVVKRPEVIGTGSGAGAIFTSDVYSKEIKEEQAKEIKGFVEKLDLEGLEYETRILTGEPYEEITDLAKKEDFDLIVMGRRGYSKVTRFFLGSVSQRVLSGAPCPVLVIPDKKS